MFETLKKIMLSEILEQAEYADEVYDEMTELEKELNSLLLPIEEFLLEPLNPDRRYNFISKFFSKKYKKEKKKYDLEKMEYDKSIKNYEKELKEYETKKEKLERRIKELKSIWKNKNLSDIRERYKKIKDANNISELGYTFDQVQELFKQKNIPLVLDENDTIINNESNFDKVEDLVLIHKTKYVPTNDEIKTLTNADVSHEEQIEIGDNHVDINFKLVRNTVHFAVNGEVGSHFYGSWDGMKYAVVIPFTEVPNIVNFSTGDTYTRGNVDISKGYLLCPVEEVEQIKQNNPSLTIIGYKGKSVDGIANTFITMLGYKKENVGTHGWENNDSETAMNTVLNKTNINYGEHSGSLEQKEEKIHTGINQFKAIIEQLLDKKIDYDIKTAINQLIGTGNKGRQLRLYIDNDLLSLYDGKIFEEFLEDIKAYGIVIPDYIYDMVNLKKHNNHINYDLLSIDEKLFLEKKECRSTDDFELIFIYEILKQVKELNKAKENDINTDEIEHHGLEM